MVMHDMRDEQVGTANMWPGGPYNAQPCCDATESHELCSSIITVQYRICILAKNARLIETLQFSECVTYREMVVPCLVWAGTCTSCIQCYIGMISHSEVEWPGITVK